MTTDRAGAALCPDGYSSTEPDYCSVCGAAIAPVTAAHPADPAHPAHAGAAPRAPAAASGCPDCSEPRNAGARFCEVCRFDFGASAPATWVLVVESDPALDDERDAGTPATLVSRVVAFVGPALLVGRRDDQRDIHPELALDDPGASRRHLKLLCSPEGEVQLQDLASTNGTQVNGVAVAPGTRRVLRDGDAVTLGRWTRIVVRAGS